MTHVPERHDRRPQAYAQAPVGTNPSGQVEVSARAVDKIIYGPKGDVLKRIEDRPFLGYHRDNGVT